MAEQRRFIGFLTFASLVSAGAWAALVVPNEVQQPGTQPGQAQIDSTSLCDNCHGNFDPAGEPWFNWTGSVMAHASRDPIFWATVSVAERDFDGSGDLCIRCHVPKGWLAGRSTPTDGSGLAQSDAEGVNCDLCHRLTNPDTSEHLGVQVAPFIAHDTSTPPKGFYGSGMYVISTGNAKLGPYADADARHQFLKSNFHRSGDLCGTCHDVSNPVVGDLAHNNGAQLPLAPGEFSGVPGSAVEGKAAFRTFPHRYGAVERTFSEWKSSAWPGVRVSAYATLPAALRAGAVASANSAAQLAGNGGDYADGTPRFFTCQSCHMRPTVGQGCNKNPPLRADLPLHDLTGGNYWAPDAIQYLDSIGALVLGGGLTAAQNSALDVGALRAKENLEEAASLATTGNRVRVTNLTGHKLISGYPEGRRMWLRVRWRDAAETLLAEDGGYGPLVVQIDGAPVQVETLRDLHDPYTKMYEAHGAMTVEWANQLLSLGTPADLPLSYDRVSGAVTRTLGQLALQPPDSHRESFHFVLNNRVARDTRIPPYGMAYTAAAQRSALPVPATQYGSPGPGGAYDYWDDVVLDPPPGAHHATIELLYQPTSWEYVQFLYLTSPRTGFLGAEGPRILDAWRQTSMAAPHTMATVAWTNLVAACADGFDNDHDGFADFPLDPGCATASDESEHATGVACDDRLDEDGDGETDYPRDPACTSPTATTEIYDEGDGVVDGLDNCPFEPNSDQLDANFDERGDACECGDPDDDGLLTQGDVDSLRAALARVTAGVVSLRKCNAIGDTNASDADGDGVPDDCDVLDVAVLRRALQPLPPGITQVCAAALP
jgi:hypothetical protein